MAIADVLKWLAWANAYKSNTRPELSGDGWIWMLHGDLAHASHFIESRLVEKITLFNK